ncbi:MULTISPECIES: hypothetical protein [unclassified Prevotella]|uniref:hypothetical protein n=1 Tax=unclassified Prevotella TaxID=2638335 RepID=UPI0004917087|nr:MULTISPECIES: hypothetical protein [unclassified Prevotella]
MDFKLIKLVGKLLVCICIFLSCRGIQKSSIDDFQIVWATDYSENGLDFLLNKDTTYIYPDSTFLLKKGMSFYSLSDQEYSLAKDILRNYFNYYLYDRDGCVNEEPFRLRKYFRQYVGYKKNDSIYVYVNLYTHFPIIREPECMCTISPSQNVLVYKEEGGRNYGTAIIDIANKMVIYFKVNSTDSNYKAGGYSEKELKILFPHMESE